MFIQTLNTAHTAKVRTGWPYRWFWKIFEGFAKSPHVLRSSWILNECNWYWKIVKYCILSEVCMIKTAPHSIVSPQMWCLKGMKVGLHTPRFDGNILWNKLLKRKKIRPDLFSKPNLLWWRAIVVLQCDQRWLLFVGVHMRLSTRCTIWLTLRLFANYFSLKSLNLSLKSHINVL